jgi:hypothetical protein
MSIFAQLCYFFNNFQGWYFVLTVYGFSRISLKLLSDMGMNHTHNLPLCQLTYSMHKLLSKAMTDANKVHPITAATNLSIYNIFRKQRCFRMDQPPCADVTPNNPSHTLNIKIPIIKIY